MSAYTDDRPYSLDLVGAVGVFFAQTRLLVLMFVLGIGATTGRVYRQDALSGLESNWLLR